MTSLAFSSPSLQTALLRGAVLVLATAWIYSPVYHGEFLWDDSVLVTDNWMVQSGSLGGLAAIWVEPDGPDYFPLTYTALWLQWQAFGDNPTGYHLVNIGLHALSGLLLWGLLHQLKLPGAWLAALIFTVHPVCVESVAWISEIKNTLSLPLFLLACWCWVRQDDCQQPSARNWWYCGSLLAFLLALLAKPTMVGLPLLTLLYAWWQRQTVSRQDLLRMLPMLLLAVGMGLVTVWFQQERAIAGEPLPIGGPLSRLAVAGLAIAFYLATIVWPVGLIPVYPQWSVQPVEAWQLLPWAGLAVVGWVSWRHRSGWGRHVIMAGGFFLLMVAPVLGFVDMAFMRISWVSDHFLYLPMIGPLVGLVAWFVSELRTRGQRFASGGIVCCGLLVLLLAGMSHAAAEHWANRQNLWTHVVQVNENAWPAHLVLAEAQLAQRNFEAAYQFHKRAAEIRPQLQSFQKYRDILIEILVRSGRYSEALTAIDAILLSEELGQSRLIPLIQAPLAMNSTKTIQVAKHIADELLNDHHDEELNVFYAGLLLRSGETGRAQQAFERILTHNPACQEAQVGLKAVMQLNEAIPEVFKLP